MNEYVFPLNEFDVVTPKPGDMGEVSMTVEVMSVSKHDIVVQKHGQLKVSEPFKEMSMQQMRDKIGVVKDELKPMHPDVEEGEVSDNEVDETPRGEK